MIAFILLIASLQTETPRPEYPQPQFQREQWLNLNGPWEFAFDDNYSGMPKAFPKTIIVPFCFESSKSGIGDAGFHPVVWYRRKIDIPRDWGNRHALLH